MMVIAKIAKFVGLLLMALAVFRVALGFLIATEVIGPYDAALARYTGKSTSGEVIDSGLYGLFIGFVVLVLAVVLQKLSARTD